MCQPCGVNTLLIGFFAADETAVAVEREDGAVRLTVDGERYRLPREAALALRESVGDALERRLELFRTVGQYRRDGSYAVARRAADTPGNEQVFDSVEAFRELFESLPASFGAEDVGGAGVTGSRRHMIVRHFAEHPQFDCRLASERPLRAEKTTD
ncbi:hypothetical protein [Halolamina sp. CBA1230]|uniref:DUF7528 family protein n=1 Tax=Halolamina sp. CBA1230 TaxID=1853690 RepID=UPI0020D01713|nr:hypothetical protein [Halolamina sp. CBA1230]